MHDIDGKYRFMLSAIERFNKNPELVLHESGMDPVFTKQLAKSLLIIYEEHLFSSDKCKDVTFSQCFLQLKEEAMATKETTLLHFIAMCYQYFLDEVDTKTAISWYKMAAQNGNNKSYFSLGILYDPRSCSSEIGADYEQSAYYYQRAMILGHHLAALNLFSLYETEGNWEYAEIIGKYLTDSNSIISKDTLEQVSDRAKQQRSGHLRKYSI